MDHAYDVSGIELTEAYDKSENRVYAKPFSLKIMAYNVGTWYLGNHDNVPAELDSEYYSLQNGIISNNNADILLLEEYAKEFSKTGRTAKSMLEQYYPYIHEQGGDNAQASVALGRCVCSKYPITDYAVHEFDDGTGFYCDTCTITVNNIPIKIGITHLHWNNRTYRSAEAQEILGFISAAKHSIVGGDFNTEDFYSVSGADYTQVIKKFIDAGYNISNGGDFGFIETYTAETTLTNTQCLDNIIASSNIVIEDAYADTTKATDGLNEKIDHLPFVSELKVYY